MAETASAPTVSWQPVDGDAYWRVTFGGGKGNVLDRPTMQALGQMFRRARATRGLKALFLEGAGAHFSFGASVREHLPADVADMLAEFREMVFDVLSADVIVVAVVRGQCLGGGLELASLCHRIVAGRDAKFGQPEIALGVFAPVASIVLPERLGRGRGEDLCLTGRSVGVEEAFAMGLVDEIAVADPFDAALAWAREHLSARSASSLRLAVRAVRASLAARLEKELPALEALYLDELMATSDAVEGLEAFLERRPPVWRHA